MELINATRMEAGYTLGVEPSGRELLVVVVKGTFRIPTDGGSSLRLHEEQVPLAMSDVFFGEPGMSAPKYEVDFSPRKPRCDVLLNGTAYAPRGRPATRVAVGLRIGDWTKSFAVLGNRLWYTAGGILASAPTSFIEMPISYDCAFGGVDQHHEDPGQHAAFMPNPSGRGFHRHMVSEWLEGSPLPNTEELGTSVTSPGGAYRPMSYGAIGRHWEPRLQYAGTYDQHWRDTEFPFLPSDFDERYYQSAPPDQQLVLPPGEQLVSLRNLTPDGARDFYLPDLSAPVWIFPKRGASEELTAQVDTILIEPTAERVMLTWRVTRPLRRNLFEIAQVLVGKKGSQWWDRRERLASPFGTNAESAAAAQSHGS